MATKRELVDWLVDALKQAGGKSNIIDICKYVWNKHKNTLQESGDLFYTWQYDIRWAATELRKKKIMKPANNPRSGVWELTEF